MLWYKKERCLRCIYYEIVSEDMHTETIFCNSPLIDLYKIWDISQCDFRIEKRPGEKVGCFDDHFVHASDFGL